jgi:hypothetical protein
MTSDTWTNRDLPVLRAIVDLFEQQEEDEGGIEPWEIERRTGFDEQTVQKALRVLNRQPYFEDAQVTDSGKIWEVGAPTAEALRVAGQWPSPEAQLERLIAAFEAAAADESRPEEERSRAKQVGLWLAGALSQVAIGALGGAGGDMLSGL